MVVVLRRPMATAAVGLVELGLAATLFSAPLLAQYSPNCERNGRRDYCAYTPAAAGNGLDAGQLVFADHSVYGLRRDERSCRDRGLVRMCKAWILAPQVSASPQAATYRGTAYEGGYRHEYLSPKLSLSFSFLD